MALVTVNAPLVPLLEHAEVDRRSWPPHLTVLPNCEVPDVAAVAAAVHRVAAATRPLEATVRGRARFGPARDVPVALVVRSPALVDLHARLTDAVRELGARFLEPAHLGPGWYPHVTDTADRVAEQGAVLRLDRLVLAELRGSRALILRVLPLVPAPD